MPKKTHLLRITWDTWSSHSGLIRRAIIETTAGVGMDSNESINRLRSDGTHWQAVIRASPSLATRRTELRTSTNRDRVTAIFQMPVFQAQSKGRQVGPHPLSADFRVQWRAGFPTDSQEFLPDTAIT
jgi:hypothetical protein